MPRKESMNRWIGSMLGLLTLLPVAAGAQTPTAKQGDDTSDLRYVVTLNRHGVRSPTGKAAQYNLYATGTWPEWPVQPGYLTPHGFHLIELLGAYDRAELAGQGLLQPAGCTDAAHITIYTDSDQRTRETGKALAQGLMPGCAVSIQSLNEGVNDPLFHPVPKLLAHLDPALARAAVAGRIGGDPANLTLAYHAQIAALDKILATCGDPSPDHGKRTSLFDIPSTLTGGNGDHLADLKGPINTASTLAENLLLEYTEGMDPANVGWGCVHRDEIQSLMILHSAATDFTQRTPEIARAQASDLLDHIRLSLQQAAGQKPIPGAIGKPSDRALYLIGHDTNLENVAGLLNLTWIADGRRDDTPPGSALVFELWQKRSSGEYSVRSYFTAQTLEQMRSSNPLTLANPIARVPLFLPGCAHQDMSCPLPAFLHLLDQVIDMQDVPAR
jgi:4-phytase/acid phosphatase